MGINEFNKRIVESKLNTTMAFIVGLGFSIAGGAISNHSENFGSLFVIIGVAFFVFPFYKKEVLKKVQQEQIEAENKKQREENKKIEKLKAEQNLIKNNQIFKEKIKIIDDNLKKIIAIELNKPCEFKNNVTENEQIIIERSSSESLHKMIKISSFLEDLHRNLSQIRQDMRMEADPEFLFAAVTTKLEAERHLSTLDRLQEDFSRKAAGDFRDRSPNGLLKQLIDITQKAIPAFKKEIAQVAYLEGMANSMLLFLLNNKQVLYFEILEIFDKLGALDSSWQKNMSERMRNVEDKLDLIMGGLLNLNNNFERLLEKNDDILKSLDSIESGMKSNNLIQAITAYQVYRLNKGISKI